MKRLRVGVIGTGVMGSFHIRQYKSIPEVELVGVFDGDMKRAAETAEKNQVRSFDKIHDLLSEVEALTIATPTSTHHKIGMECLSAGKHVLIEKPIASEIKDAEELIRKAAGNKLVLSVGHIERFNPAYGKARELSKDLDIELVDAKRCSPYPDRITDASVVLDMMIHDIDLVMDLVRSRIVNVGAKGEKIRSKTLDKVIANLAFENGVIANIEADRTSNEKVRRLVVTTADHTLTADLLNKGLNMKRGEINTAINVKQCDQLRTELLDFVSAINNNKLPEVTGQQALEVLKIAKMIEENAV